MSERADFKTRFSSTYRPNPANTGRKAGSRNKLSQDFLGDLVAVYAEKGKAAIEHVATHEQATFFKALIALQPKEVQITSPESELTDEQIEALYQVMLERLNSKRDERAEELGKKTVN